MVSLSQSGASPDIVRTLEAARAGGAITAAIVNQADSPLARAAAHVLPQHAGPEKQRRRHQERDRHARRLRPAGRDLAAGPGAAGGAGPAARAAGSGARLRLERRPAGARAGDPASTWSAAGPGSASPRRPALKLKETSGVLAEALSAAEIQHGPKAVIGPGFPVLVYGLADPGGEDAPQVRGRSRRASARR